MRRIVVALDDVSAPRGRLELGDGEGRAFDGWLELISALDAALQALSGEDESPDTPVLEAGP